MAPASRRLRTQRRKQSRAGRRLGGDCLKIFHHDYFFVFFRNKTGVTDFSVPHIDNNPHKSYLKQEDNALGNTCNGEDLKQSFENAYKLLKIGNEKLSEQGFDKGKFLKTFKL